MTLDQIEPGNLCSVLSFDNKAADILPRFYIMGLLPLAQLQVMRRAPLGDPIVIKVANTLWSIRASEAALINVKETA